MEETDLRDLAERTQEIHRLTEVLGWELFRDRAHAEIAKHQRSILSGRLSEADYRREAGWVEGALAILGLPEQTMKEFLARREAFDAEHEEEEVPAGAA